MNISLRRSGGFAGIPLECRIAAEELDPADRAELEGLVVRAHPETLDSSLSAGDAPVRPADLMRYELAIDRPGRTIHLSFDDGTLPPQLAPLIDWLCERLRPTELHGGRGDGDGSTSS